MLPSLRKGQKAKGGVIKQRENDQREQSDLNISNMRTTDFFTLYPNKLQFEMELFLIPPPGLKHRSSPLQSPTGLQQESN